VVTLNICTNKDSFFNIYSFVIHHQTPEGKGIAPFMPVLKHKVQVSSICIYYNCSKWLD